MESVFMHFDANYVSIMCEWAIVNYRTGILGTSVTKQKGKDLAVVHTWSLTIGPLLYLVPGTIPYHVPTGRIQHFDPNYGLVRPQSTSGMHRPVVPVAGSKFFAKFSTTQYLFCIHKVESS